MTSSEKFNRAKELAAQCNNQPLWTQYLQKGRNNGDDKDKFACPFCGSGTGEKGTGDLHNYGDHGHCFSCNKDIRNIDIAAIRIGIQPDSNGNYTGKDFFAVVEEACRLAGITYDVDQQSTGYKQQQNVVAQPQKQVDQQSTTKTSEVNTPKDHSKFYEMTQAKLKGFIDSQGGTFRGLTLADWQAVSAGYHEFDDGKCIVLPYDKHTFFRRAVNAATPKMKNKGGKVQIYNPYKILKCGKIIFVVEGEIDCISIHKLGYPVVATGGIAQTKIFLEQLDSYFKEKTEKPVFIVLFDNNDSGNGQKAAADFVEALVEGGYLAVNFILSPIEKFDPNKFLQKDPAGFSARLKEIYSAAASELDNLKKSIELQPELQRAKTYGTDFNFFYQNKFFDSVNAGQRFKELKSGFDNLDKVQTEWEKGLYVVGAPPSAGKTTFIWQMLEQMARQKDFFGKYSNHCVFVSYEMSESTLFSKSLARGIFELNREQDKDFIPKTPLTAAQIRKGGWAGSEYAYDLMTVLENFQTVETVEISGRDETNKFDLRFLDLSERPAEIDDLISRLQAIADEVPQNEPLIFGIDYLQAIPNKQDNVRAAIDDTLQKLRAFTLKNDVIIFLISAFNRSAYNTETNFGAFKESGLIEYAATVIWGLHLFATDSSGNFSTSETDYKRSKKREPRQMYLSCIKNRLVNDYLICFEYYSACDAFVSSNENFFGDEEDED